MARPEGWWFPEASGWGGPGLCDEVGVLDGRHIRELLRCVRGTGRLGSCRQGESHFYVEAPSGAGAGGEGGAVSVGDGADDGQAKPVSLAVQGSLDAELPERLEQVFYRVWRDAGAGVADRHEDACGRQCR